MQRAYYDPNVLKEDEDERKAQNNAEIIINQGIKISQDGYEFHIPTVNVNFWKTLPVVKHARLDVTMDKILESGYFPRNNRIHSSFKTDQQFYVNDNEEIVLDGNVVVVLTLLNVDTLYGGQYLKLRTKFVGNKVIYPYELASGSSAVSAYYFDGSSGFMLLRGRLICYIINGDSTEDVYEFYLPYLDRDPSTRHKLLYKRYPFLNIFKNMFNESPSDGERITAFINQLTSHDIPDFKLIRHYKLDHNKGTSTIITENKSDNIFFDSSSVD